MAYKQPMSGCTCLSWQMMMSTSNSHDEGIAVYLLHLMTRQHRQLYFWGVTRGSGILLATHDSVR
jgi:hypothetical protein